jgi:hypothetical protein
MVYGRTRMASIGLNSTSFLSSPSGFFPSTALPPFSPSSSWQSWPAMIWKQLNVGPPVNHPATVRTAWITSVPSPWYLSDRHVFLQGRSLRRVGHPVDNTKDAHMGSAYPCQYGKHLRCMPVYLHSRVQKTSHHMSMDRLEAVSTRHAQRIRTTHSVGWYFRL